MNKLTIVEDAQLENVVGGAAFAVFGFRGLRTVVAVVAAIRAGGGFSRGGGGSAPRVI